MRGITPLLAIARNTYLDAIRIPAFGLVVMGTLAAYALSPLLAMFSLRGEANQLLKDFGVSTLLLAGWVLTCLASSHVVRREIDERTTLVVLSKPVSRGLFLTAKFAGVAAAVLQSSYLFTLALLLAARQQPATSVHHPTDWPVLVGGLGGLLSGAALAGVRNFLKGRSFSSSLVCITTPTLTAGFLLALFFDRHWQFQVVAGGFDPLIPLAVILSLGALMILAAFSVATSVWLSPGGTFAGSALFFLAGLSVAALPDGWRRLLFFLPDFQIFWVGEVFYRSDPRLPPGFIALSLGYAALYAAAYLAAGSWLLRRRPL